MTSLAFLFVIISAFIHAFWNFSTKRVSGNISVLYIALWIACIVSIPFAVGISLSGIDILPAVPFILATGIIHAIYFFALSEAYNHGDISVVYPIARGSGVAGTALCANLLLNESISSVGCIGILFICFGTILIGFKGSYKKENYKDIFFALIVGLCIVGYSLIDKQAVGIINPVVYIFSMFLVATILLTPYILIKKRNELLRTWRKYKKFSIIIGIGSIGTYLIILFAFRLANVSYVVAARESSVAIGAIAGFIILNEKSTLRKIVGIFIIILGLIMVKIA